MTASMIAENGFILFNRNSQVPFADGLFYFPELALMWNPAILVPWGTKDAHCGYCGRPDLSLTPYTKQPGILPAVICRNDSIDDANTHITMVHQVRPLYWNGIRQHLGTASPHQNVVAWEQGFYETDMSVAEIGKVQDHAMLMASANGASPAEMSNLMFSLMGPSKITEIKGLTEC